MEPEEETLTEETPIESSDPEKTPIEGETPDPQKEDEIEYKTKTAKRFEELTGTNRELKTQLQQMQEQVQKLAASKTDEERNEALEALEALDRDGFTSYKELGKTTADYALTQLRKEQAAKEEAKKAQDANQLSIWQKQLDDLVALGAIGSNDKDKADFLNWTAKQLDATKTPERPEGNMDIYGDFHRAIYHYDKYRAAQKAEAESKDEAKDQRQNAKNGESRTVETSARKYSPADLAKMSWSKALENSNMFRNK